MERMCTPTPSILATLQRSWKVYVQVGDFAPFCLQILTPFPVPVGRFNASSKQTIPSEFASKIPSIAFSVPDIALQATLELKRLDDGTNVGCVVADLSNGKSIDSVAITYIAAGIVGAALLISAATSVLSALSGASGGPGEQVQSSPSFTTMVGWFQGIATTGMASVTYPALYQSFTERFAFSTGLVTWEGMQRSIDSFRAKTGGNVTASSVDTLKQSTSSALNSTTKLLIRQTTQTPINPEITKTLGISKYVEDNGITQENAFMTIFLITMIIILTIIVFLLLFKAILEAWAVFGNFPASLTGFRKHYWGSIFRTVVMLINLIFPIWVLYSIYQFRNGDPWGANLLAGITLAIFAGTLIFFIVRIYMTARAQIKLTGSASRLFEDKAMWLKYSLFYDNLKKETWWFFAAYIFYSVLRNVFVAALSGKGMVQTIAVLACDVIMLVIMCFLRPFAHRTENVVHITIQVVRVATWGAILVFVDELKVERSTQTIMGFALVIVTSILTVLLVGLMLFNGIYQCVKDNPHRKRRKEAGKFPPPIIQQQKN